MKIVNIHSAVLSSDLLKDWSATLNELYKKTPKLKKTNFAIQKYVKLKYNVNSEVLAYTGYNSQPLRFNNCLKKDIDLQKLTLNSIPKPGINDEKKKDMQFFIQYLKPENQTWLSNIVHSASNQDEDNWISDEESDFED